MSMPIKRLTGMPPASAKTCRQKATGFVIATIRRRQKKSQPGLNNPDLGWSGEARAGAEEVGSAAPRVIVVLGAGKVPKKE